MNLGKTLKRIKKRRNNTRKNLKSIERNIKTWSFIQQENGTNES